jgi:hypothetical protein
MKNSPATPARAAPNFGEVWAECDNQRTRYTIYRDLLLAEAAAAIDPAEAANCIAASLTRARLVEIYDVLMRLIEGVRDDGVILNRLAAVRQAKEAAAIEAAGGDDDVVSADA